MDLMRILEACDHTLLRQTATLPEIYELCDEAILYNAASVCIPPCYVRRAKAYMEDQMRICTVIGFPNGNTTAEAKSFEAADALRNGADELDMVINIGYVKAGMYDAVLDEIDALRTLRDIASQGRETQIILKVIVETCLLTEEEKIKMCEIVTKSGADYIKTSTGFGGAGATFEDVALFAKHIGPDVKIKAAGGIATLLDAQRFLDLGASRLGTSRIIKILKTAGKQS